MGGGGVLIKNMQTKILSRCPFNTMWRLGILQTFRKGLKSDCQRVGKGIIHCWKAARNSDVDNGGVHQTTKGSENLYFHVFWFCATIVNVGIWRIPTCFFLQCRHYRLLSSWYSNQHLMGPRPVKLNQGMAGPVALFCLRHMVGTNGLEHARVPERHSIMSYCWRGHIGTQDIRLSTELYA